MRYLSENKREDMRMKKRTAARSMAALMGAAMVLTACGGGNTTTPTTGASSGGETQTASEGRSQKQISLSVRRRILLRLILRDNRIRLRVC